MYLLKSQDWSAWDEVSDELLMKVYQKAKKMEEKDLIKIVLAEIRRRYLILNTFFGDGVIT